MKRFAVVIPLLLAVAGCHSSRKAASESPASVAVAVPEAEAALPAQLPADESAAHVWDFRDASTWVLGDFTLSRIRDTEPHAQWFEKEYAAYVPDPAVMDALKKLDISDLTVTIVLGTWCPDSRREVPRFMKMVDDWGLPYEKIRFIGVDIDKMAPLGDYPAMGIERVPTFIFYKNKSEAGRIIEVPVTSLEQDTRNILDKQE